MPCSAKIRTYQNGGHWRQRDRRSGGLDTKFGPSRSVRTTPTDIIPIINGRDSCLVPATAQHECHKVSQELAVALGLGVFDFLPTTNPCA